MKPRAPWHPWLMLGPSLVLLVAFFVVPIGVAVVESLYSWDLLTPPRYVGLGNYRALAVHGELLHIAARTLAYSALVVCFTMAVGLALACLLRRPGPLFAFVRASIFSAYVVSWVAVALLWMGLLDPNGGILARFPLGLAPARSLLGDPRWALPTLAVIGAWKLTGYAMILFLAGLQGIPRSLHEAAALDGAGAWARFRHVTWPLLGPTAAFVATTTLVTSFQAFDVVRIITQGGPARATELFVYAIYEQIFANLSVGRASALTVVFFALLLAIAGLQLRVWTPAASSSRASRGASRRRTGYASSSPQSSRGATAVARATGRLMALLPGRKRAGATPAQVADPAAPRSRGWPAFGFMDPEGWRSWRRVALGRLSPEGRRSRAHVAFGLLSMAAALVWLFPYAWMILTSFKTLPEIVAHPTSLVPARWQLGAYREVFASMPVAREMAITVAMASTIAAIQVLLALPAGYALAKLRFAGRTFAFGVVLACLLVPAQATFVPVFLFFAKVRLIDTFAALVLPFGASALGIFLVRQALAAVPDEIIEAARMDGAGEWTLVYRILAPSIRPTLVSLFLVSFVFHYNDYFWPLVMTTDDAVRTLPLGVALLREQGTGVRWHIVMAGNAVLSLPVLALFALAQRHLTQAVSGPTIARRG